MQPFEKVDDPVKLRRLVQAILILEGELVLPTVLRRLVEEACALGDARYGALGVLNPSRTALEHFVTIGPESDDEQAISTHLSGLGILGTLILDAQPLRLSNLADGLDGRGVPPLRPEMSSLLGVPIRVGGEIFGNLYLTNKINAEEFSEEDEATVMVLSTAAGVAIEKARLHAAVRDHAVTEDRDRIARDLHDSVIQRLFAVGLSLQGTARLVASPEAVVRIGDAVEKLDETIRQLRTAIFDLEVTTNQEGFRRMVFDLFHELSPTLRTHPQVTFSGSVDSAMSGERADHALATLREALTNVAKHADASNVIVTIAVGEELRMVVVDDGRGMGTNLAGGRGLHNMRERAERLGGSLDLGTSREGGTRLTWRIPLTGSMEEPEKQSLK
jgi:signal transduction histidine kinase